MRIPTALSALLMLASVAAPSRADTIYNDLGPGNTWIINREYDTNSDFMAAPIVTTGSGNLGDIMIPLFSLHNPVELGLYTDSGDQPGALLESWSVVVPGIPGVLTTVPSVANPFLSASTQYWFVVALTSTQKLNLAWYENNQGITGGVWAGFGTDALINFVPGSPAPAIQLTSQTATPVPEPSSALVLAMVAALLSIFRMVHRPSRSST